MRGLPLYTVRNWCVGPKSPLVPQVLWCRAVNYPVPDQREGPKWKLWKCQCFADRAHQWTQPPISSNIKIHWHLLENEWNLVSCLNSFKITGTTKIFWGYKVQLGFYLYTYLLCTHSFAVNWVPTTKFKVTCNKNIIPSMRSLLTLILYCKTASNHQVLIKFIH